MNQVDAVAGLDLALLDSQVHDREAFTCGEPTLDAYLKRQAAQDIKRRAAVVYILTQTELPAHILGYYTLSAASVQLTGLPVNTQKKLARYPEVPAALLGRLAVADTAKGQGLGAVLLRHALRQVLASSRELAVSVMIVDALNEQAAQFYLHYGFLPLHTDGQHSRRLFLPVATIEKAVMPE